MSEQRRKKILSGGANQANHLPERDAEAVTRQLHGQRTDAELAKLDKPEFAAGKPMIIGRATATKTGLVMPSDLSSDEFRDIGTQIFTLEGVTQWWIGDYLLYAAKAWGDITDKIASYFGRERETLYNITSVARKFEISFRREILSFAHHQLVAAKSPELREQYLDIAANAEPPMTVKALREYIRIQEADPNADNTPPYEPVGSEYHRLRDRADTLLKRPLTPTNRLKLKVLLDQMNQRLTDEAQWLADVQKVLARSAGNKSNS